MLFNLDLPKIGYAITLCCVGTSAKLVLKKQPTSDQTFNIPVNIKDNAGVGVTHRFEGKDFFL